MCVYQSFLIGRRLERSRERQEVSNWSFGSLDPLMPGALVCMGVRAPIVFIEKLLFLWGMMK